MVLLWGSGDLLGKALEDHSQPLVAEGAASLRRPMEGTAF